MKPADESPPHISSPSAFPWTTVRHCRSERRKDRGAQAQAISNRRQVRCLAIPKQADLEVRIRLRHPATCVRGTPQWIGFTTNRQTHRIIARDPKQCFINVSMYIQRESAIMYNGQHPKRTIRYTIRGHLPLLPLGLAPDYVWQRQLVQRCPIKLKVKNARSCPLRSQ